MYNVFEHADSLLLAKRTLKCYLSDRTGEGFEIRSIATIGRRAFKIEMNVHDGFSRQELLLATALNRRSIWRNHRARGPLIGLSEICSN